MFTADDQSRHSTKNVEAFFQQRHINSIMSLANSLDLNPAEKVQSNPAVHVGSSLMENTDFISKVLASRNLGLRSSDKVTLMM